MKRIIIVLSLIIGLQAILIAQTNLFWTQSSPGKIEISDLSGNNRITLISGNDIVQPYGLFVDVIEQKIYWSDRVLKNINRANFDGTEIEVLIELEKRPNGITGFWGGDWIYFANESGQIQKFNKQSKQLQTIYNPINQIAYSNGIKINYETGRIYWSDSAMNKILSCSLDGSNLETIIDFGQDLVLGDLDFDYQNDKFYWTEAINKRIQMADYNGSNIEDVISEGLDNPVGIVIDGGDNKMYWTERGSIKKIMTANLDGQMKEVLVSNDLNSLYFIGLTGGVISSTKEKEVDIQIKIGPNPTSDILTIFSDEDKVEYEILDINGRTIKKKDKLNQNQILVEDLLPGAYFLYFYLNNK